MKANAPCGDCKERYFGCHSHCDKYSEFKKDWEKRKQWLKSYYAFDTRYRR